MMQYANSIMHLQQVNTTSNSIQQGNLLALSKLIFLDIHTRYNSETTGAIVLNCSELEPINSLGIRLLIMLLIYTRRQQKRMLFFGLSEHNRYIFEITRLNQFIDIVETETHAVEAL